MPNFWIGVASHDHVSAAVRGGFCQFSHGKEAPVRRLARGDLVIFYSPRDSMTSKEPLQAFTAVGEITDAEPFLAKQSADFHPYRRHTRYFKSTVMPIHELLARLSFTKTAASWGASFRCGIFKISETDFTTIATAMGVTSHKLKL